MFKRKYHLNLPILFHLFDNRMELLAGTVPPNNLLFAGTDPANKSLLAGTDPANNLLLAGTVPANNFLLAGTPPGPFQDPSRTLLGALWKVGFA